MTKQQFYLLLDRAFEDLPMDEIKKYFLDWLEEKEPAHYHQLETINTKEMAEEFYPNDLYVEAIDTVSPAFVNSPNQTLSPSYNIRRQNEL